MRFALGDTVKDGAGSSNLIAAALLGRGIGASRTPGMHEAEGARIGLRYAYRPGVSRHRVRRSALKHLLDTFFDSSPENVVDALLGNVGVGVSDEELQRMAELIERARRDGRRK